MRWFGNSCGRVRRDLLRRDELDAGQRSRLDVHLRRCPGCHQLSEQLAVIEDGFERPPRLGEDAARRIYDRLIPVVHEIAVERAAPARSWWTRPNLVWSSGLAAAVLLSAFAIWQLAPDAAQPEAAPAAFAAQATEPAVLGGLLDRLEGAVRIDDQPATVPESFPVREGTTIELDEGARFSFRIGELARVALAGDTVWQINTASDNLIEMQLDRGRLAVEFEGGAGQMLDIRTPESLVRVRGTLFTVEVLEDGATRVGVIEGRVDVVPLGGARGVVALAEGDLVTVPGGEIAQLADEQRALAAGIDFPDDYLAFPGRVVRFDGSPERVKVEVEGRVLGTTPIAVRLPEGPIAYRLTAPGMEPFEASLDDEGTQEVISFALAPAVDYRADIGTGDDDASGAPRKVRAAARAASRSSGADWGLYQRARAAMTAGDVPYAIGLLERAVEQSSGERLVTGLSLLAECYAAVGRYSMAADTFDRVASLAPGTGTAQNSRYEVGRLAMDRLGNFARARAAFTAYVASPLGGALREEAYYSLCEIESRDGAHRDALHCFNEFLRAFPGGHHEPDARLWRGALYQDVERRWADAERDLAAFLAAKPRHPRCGLARYRIALGRYQTGDRRGALRMIDEYLREHPGGQYDVRAKRLRRAILDPDFSWEPDSK